MLYVLNHQNKEKLEGVLECTHAECALMCTESLINRYTNWECGSLEDLTFHLSYGLILMCKILKTKEN